MYRLVYTLAFILLGVSSFAIESAFAHGVTATSMTGNTVAVHFEYAGGDPMSYAEVLVFAPESKDGDVEFQNGRTDAKGNFAFIPDKTGTWSISATDMGHRAELQVPVTQGGVVQASSTAVEASQSIRVILGISIILNLLCAALLMKRRKAIVENN